MKRSVITFGTIISVMVVSAAGGQDKTRVERDLIGEKEIPADAYYGVQTARALENFQISGSRSITIPGSSKRGRSSSWRRPGRTRTSAP